MPIYQYVCTECEKYQEHLSGIDERLDVKCDACGAALKQVIYSAPNLSIPPQHRAAPDLSRYYNADRITGKPINKKGK